MQKRDGALRLKIHEILQFNVGYKRRHPYIVKEEVSESKVLQEEKLAKNKEQKALVKFWIFIIITGFSCEFFFGFSVLPKKPLMYLLNQNIFDQFKAYL